MQIYQEGDKTTKPILLTDVLKKIDNVFNISGRTTESLILTPVTFKKIMMLYPDDGIVISSERTIKEKYRCLKEFGFVNPQGRVNTDEFLRWLE